ncbi:hypothetical protein EOL96_04435 [Candidatus Saccharibacteria bacterium]|nr:hypothetical protein [Candidatus Saccharibacteria bacterium]
MTTSPHSKDHYQIPQSAGAVEFSPDTRTGEEQVDLHASNLSTLAQLTRDTLAHAQSAHQADPTNVDTRRIEFGGSAIGAATTADAREVVVFDPTDTAPMLESSLTIVRLRAERQRHTAEEW